MTNQPDESHPMRERVDKAISWFTQTDEPDAVDETDEQGAVAEPAGHTPETAASREPLTPAGEPTTSRDTETTASREPVTPAGEPTTSRDTETAASREPVTPAGEPIGSRDAAAEQAARADEQVSQTGPLTSEERAAETDRDVARSEDRIPEPEEALARQDERTSGAAPAAAGGALVGGTAAAGAVAEHERRREAERDVEREREADQAPVGEAPADRTGEAPVDEDTHVRRHEPPASWAEVHPNARQVPPEGAIDSEAETTGSQRSLYRDEAPTVAMPAAAAAAAAAGAATAGHGEPTAVMDATEFARLRREERAARDRQLGKVIAQDDADEPVPTRYTTPSTYRGLPSLGLLLFRLVVAAVLGIRAWQHVTHLSATRATWAATLMPSPGTVAYAQIGLEIAIATMLVLGLGTRIAGLLLLVLSVVSLVFVQWGAVNPFQPGANDFIGVVDVLLAGAGLLFATVGGGRAAFDGAIHSGRIRRKNDKLFA